MSAWTAEESAAYEARQAAERKIADAGNLALRAFLKEARKEELKEAFDQFLDQVRNEFDLWAMYNLLVSAYSSASLFEGLRSMLQAEGAKAVWDSFEEDPPKAEDLKPSFTETPEFEPVDEENRQHQCYFMAMCDRGEHLQDFDLTREDFIALKRHLATLRGVA